MDGQAFQEDNGVGGSTTILREVSRGEVGCLVGGLGNQLGR